MSTRRRKGDGSVRERGPDRWELRYRDRSGRPVSVTVRGTEADAHAQLRDKLVERDKGQTVVGRRYTLGRWIPVWLESIPEGRLRPRSIVRYKALARHWERDPIAHKKVADLEPEHITAALNRFKRTGMSAGGQHQALTILRIALDAAVKSRVAARNAARLVDAPRAVAKTPDIPSGDELTRLRRAIAVDRLEALWLLALDAGLRQGEALALRWGDVDLERGRISVTGTLEYGTGVVGPPKSKRGRRVLPVRPSVVAALRRWWDASLGPNVAPMPRAWVFATREGRPMHARNVLTAWYRVCAKAGTRRYRMHDLRHVAITQMLEEGMPVVLASRYFGHSTIGMTVDTYGHQDLEKAAPWLRDRAIEGEEEA